MRYGTAGPLPFVMFCCCGGGGGGGGGSGGDFGFSNPAFQSNTFINTTHKEQRIRNEPVSASAHDKTKCEFWPRCLFQINEQTRTLYEKYIFVSTNDLDCVHCALHALSPEILLSAPYLFISSSFSCCVFDKYACVHS